MKTLANTLFVWAFTASVLIGLLSSCSTWQQDADTAADTLRTACEAGLVEQAAVLAEAQRLGLETAQVAAYLCSIPAIYEAFSPLIPRGSHGPPASRAVGTARELGVVR